MTTPASADTEGIPLSVQKFVLDYIGSVEQLEVLLLLYREPGRPKTATAIANELRSSRTSVLNRLEDLVRHRLAKAVPSAAETFVAAVDSVHVATINEVQKVYQERRIRMINLIFSRPIDKLRTFAEAFRFKDRK